jgi:hypothetical protein
MQLALRELVIVMAFIINVADIICVVIKEMTSVMLYGALRLFFIVLLVSGQKAVNFLASCHIAPKDLLCCIQNPELTSGR